jgi:hypothetical protein
MGLWQVFHSQERRQVMRKQIALLVVLAVAGLCATAIAQEVDKTVILFRSMDDPDIQPDLEVCGRAIYPLDPPEGVVLVPLGASPWSSLARILNGEVLREKVRQMGQGTMCLWMTDELIIPFHQEAPAYFEGTLNLSPWEEVSVALSGECEATNQAFLEGGPVFAGCYLDVLPDRSTDGIKWGQAVTNTTFTLFPVPGFETDSFWSLQLVWE